jgi:hypothetical protein
MKQVKYMLGDLIVAICETMISLFNRVVRKPQPRPSLLAHNIAWCTESNWLERLRAYKQMDLWTGR